MQTLSFSDEVRLARHDGVGLVALESTLISHGLPHPDNITVATDAEAAVRKIVFPSGLSQNGYGDPRTHVSECGSGSAP